MYLETTCIPRQINKTRSTEFVCPSNVYNERKRRHYFCIEKNIEIEIITKVLVFESFFCSCFFPDTNEVQVSQQSQHQQHNCKFNSRLLWAIKYSGAAVQRFSSLTVFQRNTFQNQLTFKHYSALSMKSFLKSFFGFTQNG